MVSVKHLFVANKPTANLPYTGTMTKELNNRQKYTKFHKKPKELVRHLKPTKEQLTPINQDVQND
jgi:hypothetical protein